MPDNTGMKMRIIALDELMKCCTEVGRNLDNDEQKALLKALYEAARTRHEFLALNRSEGEHE